MKSSFELAMERLNKTAPPTKLSAQQKQQIAELESRYKAKIAEREIAMKAEMASAAGDPEASAKLQEQLSNERKKLLADLEEKKELVRKL